MKTSFTMDTLVTISDIGPGLCVCFVMFMSFIRCVGPVNNDNKMIRRIPISFDP